MRSIKALAPARIKWAIELLGLDKKHNVFEIGYGSGVAAQHICAKLGRGTYQGVDQSAAAAQAALARNSAYARAGRAIFENAAFNAETHEPALFDRVLAVNVNAFWADDGEAARDVRRLMHNKSRCVLVFQPPEKAARAKIARAVKKRLAPYFGDVRAQLRTIGGAPLVAIIASVTAPPAKQAKRKAA